MYAPRFFFFVLAFVITLVDALPIHNHWRRCRALSASSSPEISSSPTASLTATAVLLNSPTESSTESSSSSATISASSSGPSSTPSSTSKSDGSLSSLFPVSSIIDSWTTSTLSDDALPLSDSTLQPHSEISALSHDYVTAPDGVESVKAFYPQGSYTFKHDPQGGFSFYAPGPNSLDLTTAKEATFGYSVFFEDGFEFNKGGKLLGLYGGNDEDTAQSCSGGRRSDECFSARLMFRTDGAGEIYTYLPPSFDANSNFCNDEGSECNPTYGASINRGAFSFKAGERTTVSQRVRLNDVGQENGELELFVGGESVISASGLVLRNSEEGKIRGMMFQTFFGGSTSDWASPQDQNAYFYDFSVAITESL
ncbi:hypothetical protein EV421DRAFT_1925193 [Armillaria borealis]|uniref:Polysaccharide lyase 14 domain-containing protein n=1 Tax=Armillaria borealis TaxID=47425 RepID=A0AA39IWP4_9AGAR|nr:hypothetical protein EV421DRAFT_1925193 [Armillaria borealis]